MCRTEFTYINTFSGSQSYIVHEIRRTQMACLYFTNPPSFLKAQKAGTDHLSIFPLVSMPAVLSLWPFSSLPSLPFLSISLQSWERREEYKREGEEEKSFILRPSASCYCCRDYPPKRRQAGMTLLWNSALMRTLLGKSASQKKPWVALWVLSDAVTWRW